MHHLFDKELEIFCCLCFYDKYIILINENQNLKKFCWLDECFKTNNANRIETEKDSILIKQCF